MNPGGYSHAASAGRTAHVFRGPRRQLRQRHGGMPWICLGLFLMAAWNYFEGRQPDPKGFPAVSISDREYLRDSCLELTTLPYRPANSQHGEYQQECVEPQVPEGKVTSMPEAEHWRSPVDCVRLWQEAVPQRQLFDCHKASPDCLVSSQYVDF